MKIITYSEAKRAGLLRYFTGKPCPFGHIDERTTCNGNCCACQREKVKRYVKNNPEKVRVWAATSQKRQLANNPERVHATKKRYKVKNRAKYLADALRYMADNVHKTKLHKISKRIGTKRVRPEWANDFFMAEAYRLMRLRTKLTGIQWSVDHIVPLKSKRVCGLHVHNNLCVIPQRSNLLRGNRSWPEM